MALPGSGPLSMGSIAAELGRSSTGTISLNDADVRLLGGRSGGAVSIGDFFGKSSYFYQSTMTIGGYIGQPVSTLGFSRGSFGSMSPDMAWRGATVNGIYTINNNLLFTIDQPRGNDNWSSLEINTSVFYRENGEYSTSSSSTAWIWRSVDPTLLSGGTRLIKFK